jgi:uncharacterized damage-inducible protein DinB
MDLAETIRQLYDYNYWANRRYFTAAEALTEQQLRRSQGHSWDSIYAVLLHMLSAEWIWLRRWNGESPRSLLRPEDFPDLPAIRKRWDGLEMEMRAFVAAQTGASLQKELAYTNTRGENFHLPLWQMMLHVANHNTHHRGELAAMFALMNVPHPEDEAYHYFLEASGQK